MRATAHRFTGGISVRLASLAVVLTMMSGCVGIVPLPTTSSRPINGHKIARQEVAFIRPGRTTRSKVVEHLGYDYTALPLNRAFAYTWELPGGGGFWWYAVAVPPSAAAADGGTWEGGWRAFFVAFDDRDVVVACTFKKLSPSKPLHEHLDRWVARLPHSKSGDLIAPGAPLLADSP